MIRGVIFDLDGTLYDEESCYHAAMESLADFAQNKFGMSPEKFAKIFAESRESVKLQLGNVAASHNRLLYLQRFLEAVHESPINFALEMYEVYWGTVLSNMHLFPYVLPLFRHLKAQGIRIAILSDLTAHIQHRKIKALGVDSFIDVLVTSEEAGEEKPSRKMFSLVMKKLNMKPEELIMIGNSLERDVYGAEAVGIKSVHCTELLRDDGIIEEVMRCL